MKKMTTKAIYSRLRKAICKDKPIPDADWNEFIEKTKIDWFKESHVIVHPGQLSTHSYFIIEGMMMCYIPRKPKNSILWFRAEGEHAFTTDKLNFGKPSRENEERLIALEDTIAVSISHEDLLALQENNRIIFHMMHEVFIRTLVRFDSLSKRSNKYTEHDYKWVQRYVTFNLDRIPAAYLATYLGTSVKKLADVHKLIQQ